MYVTENFCTQCKCDNPWKVGQWVIIFPFASLSFCVVNVTFTVRKVIRKSSWLPMVLTCLSPPLFSRLSQNLDGVVVEFLFRQSKISEVLGGSGYNSDRLGLPYIPQLTSTSSAQGFPSPPLAFLGQVRA